MRPHTRRVIRAIYEALHVVPGTTTFIRGAEVGVFRGHSSQALLDAFPGMFLTMVDPFTETGFKSKWTAAMAEKEAEEVTSFASDRRVLLKEPSLEAATHFDKNALDFVFLDANHTYEHVKADVQAWWQVLKPKGVLIGHDYGCRLDLIGKYGVKKAVDEFVAQYNLELHVESFLVWWIVKP